MIFEPEACAAGRKFCACVTREKLYLVRMTIWILAALLFGFFAWMGYAKGAIRVLVMLAGLILAALVALPLTPVVKPLFPMMGVTSPYLLWVLPPVAVFVLVQLLFAGLAFLAHHQVSLHFKYKTDDLHRL